MLAEISKVVKGPKILYEISSPVEESPADKKEESVNGVADNTEENINIPTDKNQEPGNSSTMKNETNNIPEVERNQLPPFEISVSKYSNNWRLLRISAWANRLINNICFKEKTFGPLTAKEIENARM